MDLPTDERFYRGQCAWEYEAVTKDDDGHERSITIGDTPVGQLDKFKSESLKEQQERIYHANDTRKGRNKIYIGA